MPEQAPTELTPEHVRRVLRSRRMRERFLHLRYYRNEPPGRSLGLGLELSLAAHLTRQEDPA